MPMSDVEVPRPDAAEQDTPVVEPARAGVPDPPDDPEVPEADGIEQAQPAPVDDDEAWR